MNLKLSAALTLLLIAGCRSAPPTPQEQQATALKALHSDRLKRSETAGVSALIIDPDGSLDADGMWIPEPDDKAHALAYPEQTHIICNVGAEYCIEMKISFIVIGGFLSVKGPEETLWPIKTWDKRSLLAEYGPFTQFQPGPEKCQKHVLSMVFASDTVTTSDIPTHSEGCEEFKETNSYRLANGWYNVDISPNNDAIRDTTPYK